MYLRYPNLIYLRTVDICSLARDELSDDTP